MGAGGRLGRFYRVGRKTYGLSAVQAIEYARDLIKANHTEAPGWGYEVDPEGDLEGGKAIVVFLFDEETEEILESIGGVGLDFEVSDHGNVNLDDHDPYLIHLVAELIAEHEAVAA